MKRTHLLMRISLFFLFTFMTACSAQNTSIVEVDNEAHSDFQNKQDELDSLIGKYAKYSKFNGAVLVAKEGKVIYKRGFGLANMEWDIPNQTNTKFRIASMTKQFTAMLIMQLVAQNKLSLDEPIATYLPDYPKENAAKINIHHLLTHTSGLPNYTSFPAYRDINHNPIRPSEIIKLFADSTLQFSPGKKFSYSNSGYVILGLLIEKVTGKSYEEVLKEKILKPLSMHSTGLENSKDLLKNRATGYNKYSNTYVLANYIDMSIAFSAGGIYSTVEDLFLWEQALYTNLLLPEKYTNMIFEKHISAWGQYYGYGWTIGDMPVGNTQDKMITIEHDGVINGFNSIIVRFPDDHSSVILLNNTGNTQLYEMIRNISGIMYGKTYDIPKQSIAPALYEIMIEEGIELANVFFDKARQDSTYYLDENELNLISYDLLKNGKDQEAIAALKLALKAYPNAFNLYDSYGEILRMLGDDKGAIINYTKSVRLNPKNKNGIRILKELGVKVEAKDLYLLNSPNDWNKEIFTFPLNFAKSLDYQGVEEAYFPKGWRKIESDEFWSYAFVWNINREKAISEAEIENHLQTYFDGLMNLVNKNKDFVIPNTVAKVHLKEKENNVTRFTGCLNIFDAFVTNKNMVLNVRVENLYCAKEKKYMLFFRFSPSAFDTEIWQILNNLKLRKDNCAY